MNNNNPFQTKDPFSVRLTKNEALSFQENYNLLMNTDIPEIIDNKEFKNVIMTCYDIAISKALPKNTNNSELLSKIEKLEKEINSYNDLYESEQLKVANLKLSLDEQNTLIQKLNETLKDRELQIIELKFNINNNPDAAVAERRLLSEVEPSRSDEANENTIILNISPAEKHIIESYAQNESKIKNKEITPELLIKGAFFHILFHGPFNTFKRLFSNEQLSQIIKNHKSNE